MVETSSLCSLRFDSKLIIPSIWITAACCYNTATCCYAAVCYYCCLLLLLFATTAVCYHCMLLILLYFIIAKLIIVSVKQCQSKLANKSTKANTGLGHVMWLWASVKAAHCIWKWLVTICITIAIVLSNDAAAH